MRSDVVVFPASMCARTPKFRMAHTGVSPLIAAAAAVDATKRRSTRHTGLNIVGRDGSTRFADVYIEFLVVRSFAALLKHLFVIRAQVAFLSRNAEAPGSISFMRRLAASCFLG
jgi:hypothetical protein